MRCYFDESWQEIDTNLKVGIIFGVLINKELISKLDDFLYQIRKKYYSKDHAKDKNTELKGNKLFSNRTFKIAAQNPDVMPINHCIAMEIIGWCKKLPIDIAPKVFASFVYGTDPHLRCLDSKHLDLPFIDLCCKISKAVSEIDENGVATLIFDERGGTQKGIAIAIYNFIKGVGIPHINPTPYFAVSNVDSGVQLADLFAYIAIKRATKDTRFMEWYKHIAPLQWKGTIDNKKRWGFQRYEITTEGKYKIKKGW